LQKETYIEDEIDLKKLFATIWKRKIFIATLTLCITLCTGIYAYTKIPIYEVKSYIELGFIDNKIIEEPAILEQKLKVVFGIDNNMMNNNPEKGIISSISQTKNIKNFLEIKTEAISNEIAIAKNKEVLTYTQNLYNPKIEYAKSLAETQILNLKRDIELLKTQEIKIIENEISFFENEKMKKLNDQIALYNSNLEKYNKEIALLYKSNGIREDKTNSLIVSVQLVSYQNLILNAQNQLSELKLQIEQIIKDTIPKLLIKKENINNIQIKNLEEKIETIKFSISEQNISNTRLVGDYIVKEYPSKPKKSLIIVVAFVTGFILSIFMVFFMQFISAFRKEENK
jgi:capsular polysaccharide biosynthesis protein